MYRKKYHLICLFFLFSIVSLHSQNVKNVLLEEFSTAPCGFCPEGGIIAEQIITKYPNVFTFTHHAGFGTDSMTIAESNTIAKLYTKFAPSAVIDRCHYSVPPYSYEDYLAVSRQKWDSLIAVRLNNPAKLNVEIIEKSFSENDRVLNAKVKIVWTEQVPEADYRMNFLIIEDSVSGVGKGWDQKNYFNNDPKYPSLYKKGDSIVGYQHRHVVRAMPTGTWGAIFVSNQGPIVNQDYFYELKDYKIPATWKEKDIILLAFVSVYDTSKFKHEVFNSDETELSGVPELVDEKISAEEFSVLPNPVQDLAYIKCAVPEGFEATLELFSASGVKIRNIATGRFAPNQNIYFYTSDLAAGVYFIKINTNLSTKVIKVFVL